MAEFLVKLSDSDPQDDIKTSWHYGDIFLVKHDGFIWGTEEKEPTFALIKMPGINPVVCSFLVGSWTQANGEVYRMSAWKWDFEQECFIRKQDGLAKRRENLE